MGKGLYGNIVLDKKGFNYQVSLLGINKDTHIAYSGEKSAFSEWVMQECFGKNITSSNKKIFWDGTHPKALNWSVDFDVRRLCIPPANLPV